MAAFGSFSNPTKFTVNDWKTSNMVMSSTAERQMDASVQVRQQSTVLRNTTDNKTAWTQHSTSSDLADRIGDITLWRNTLNRTKEELQNEIEHLKKTRECVEKAFEAKQVPMDITFECQGFREERDGNDLVRDEVEVQLQKEVEIIEGTNNVLLNKLNESYEQLCVLQDIHQLVTADLTDKTTALNLDTDCHELENSSGTLGLHKDPTRIMRNIVNPDTWEAFSSHNKDKSETEMKLSVRLREAMNQSILQTTSDLEAQWTATNYAFRKRLHEVEQAVRELEWQKGNTESEIAALEKEVDRLKECIAAKVPPLMVAHTRLEERTKRPNVELCRDTPQYQLVEEVGQVKESQHLLQEKLVMAEQTLGTLQRNLEQITSDLAAKKQSLSLDQQCMQVREKLKDHPSGEELIKTN